MYLVQVHSLHAYSLMQTHLVGEFSISFSWIPMNIQMHSQHDNRIFGDFMLGSYLA